MPDHIDTDEYWEAVRADEEAARRDHDDERRRDAAQVLTRLVRSSADIETIEAVAAAYGPDVDASSCASLAYELADAVAAADYARRAQHRAEYRATQAAARGQQAAANRASASALDWHRHANDLAAVAAETLAALVILLTEGANR